MLAPLGLDGVSEPEASELVRGLVFSGLIMAPIFLCVLVCTCCVPGGGSRNHKRRLPTQDPDGPGLAVVTSVHEWAKGKDIYELLASIDSFGLDTSARAGGGEDGDGAATSPPRAYEQHKAMMPAFSLRRETTTIEELKAAWDRVARALHPKRVRHLPDEKRCVAAALHRVLKEAYDEEVADDEILV